MKKASWVPHRLHQRDFRKKKQTKLLQPVRRLCPLHFPSHLFALRSWEGKYIGLSGKSGIYGVYTLKSSGLGDHVPYYVPCESAMNWSYPYFQAPREFVSENQNFRSGMLWGLLKALRSVDFNFGLTYQIRFEYVLRSATLFDLQHTKHFHLQNIVFIGNEDHKPW
jgi:hypothetical protein